ncbi:MAG: DUF3341 domain-containing protein [Planctomycetaceae bacterium]|nr:DUF3341 domain-containing protein [Planctomycetaceae bacterium]
MQPTQHLKPRDTYGVMAAFDTPEALVAAARAATAAGYKRMEAYSPFPVEGIEEALAFRPTRLPRFVFCAAVVGGLTGYGLQYYCSVIAYPLNIGGRPLHSWPAFIPVTFELTILFAAFAAVLGMLALNGLPMPYHPVFNCPEFTLASRDRFFLSIQAADPKFNVDEVIAFFEQFKPLQISEVHK